MKRAIIIVLDSLGVGELPDAEVYGDVGSNTLGNIPLAMKNEHWFKLKNLKSMGLGHIEGVELIEKSKNPLGSMIDTTAGLIVKLALLPET